LRLPHGIFAASFSNFFSRGFSEVFFLSFFLFAIFESNIRQDKARIAEKDAKYHQVCSELEDGKDEILICYVLLIANTVVQKKFQEQTESLRLEKERLCGLEVQNRNHEKIEKQLKEALKTMKEDNATLTKRLESEQIQLHKKQ
jgi:hypothetical protein